MTEIPLTLSDAARGIRERRFSSSELVEAAIERADALDATLGVYLQRFDDEARATAARADNELAAGVDRGPLHGVPIGIKDILATSEGPTTANSLVLDASWGDGRDAVVVERLRSAGAVLTGKLTTMEFAIGLHDLEKPHPRPRNPWDVNAWPGGSSSGTGAGVAAGIFPAGIGTDTGGSIRIPSAYCGISGLMPTYGRVPTAGCVPLGYSLDRIGPMTRTARDCGLFLAAISGDDPRDPYSVAAPELEIYSSRSLSGMTIGVERAHHLGRAQEDPSLESTFDAAVDVLKRLGAAIVEIEIPHYAETVTAQIVTMLSEAFAYHRADMRQRWNDYYRATRDFVASGALFTGADYVQAQRIRRVAQRALMEIFEGVDIIATPTTSTAAPTYTELDAVGIQRVTNTTFVGYWNAVGNPVLVIPMGFTEEEMPLSLQLAGRPFAEATLTAVGDAFQSETDWHLRTPPVVASCV